MPRKSESKVLDERKLKSASSKTYSLNSLERQISDDVDWAHTAPEVQTHSGCVVVVRKRRIIAVGTDRASLLRKAARAAACHEEELAVVVVPTAGLGEIPR
jgi:hypothetical protein